MGLDIGEGALFIVYDRFSTFDTYYPFLVGAHELGTTPEVANDRFAHENRITARARTLSSEFAGQANDR